LLKAKKSSLFARDQKESTVRDLRDSSAAKGFNFFASSVLEH
jgi:hypothetical protein